MVNLSDADKVTAPVTFPDSEYVCILCPRATLLHFASWTRKRELPVLLTHPSRSRSPATPLATKTTIKRSPKNPEELKEVKSRR